AFARDGQTPARPRQGDDRAVQISSLDRLCRRFAEDHDRENSALQTERGGAALTDFVATKARFHLPKGVIYLDGNSLGPLPEGAMQRAQQTIESEWGEMLIRAWNLAGWMAQPRRVGDKIALLIGARPETVVMGDTLSIKLYQALAAALAMRPERKIVLSDTGNFPTDLYMAKGLIDSLDRGHVLKTVAPEAVEDAIEEGVAALMLTHVDYGSGRMHAMARLTEKA